MTLAFRAYDEAPCNYPRPRIPVMAPPQAGMLGRSTSMQYPSVFSDSLTSVFSRGRYALLHALRTLGVGEEHAVMVPAYHCRTMIDPVVRAGADVALYGLRHDLSIDADQLANALDRAQRPVKAFLLVHYFGFPQEVEPIDAICRERGIALIEDCCHAYFGSWHGRPLGAWGDCAIGSPSKFFACEDGGTFSMSKGGTAAPLRPRSLQDESKAIYHSIEGAWAHVRNHIDQRPGRLAEEFARVREQFPQWSGELDEAGRSLSEHYRTELDATSALAWSKAIMRRSSAKWICERRRKNYAALLAGVARLPNCRALFPSLPDGVVPYMFPLLLEDPASRFHWLKHLGVPMYRWDELAISDCPVSNTYRLRLVQLPCHQALRDDDLEWLLEALALVTRAQLEPELTA